MLTPKEEALRTELNNIDWQAVCYQKVVDALNTSNFVGFEDPKAAADERLSKSETCEKFLCHATVGNIGDIYNPHYVLNGVCKALEDS